MQTYILKRNIVKVNCNDYRKNSDQEIYVIRTNTITLYGIYCSSQFLFYRQMTTAAVVPWLMTVTFLPPPTVYRAKECANVVDCRCYWYRKVQDVLIESYFQQTCATGRVQCEDGARLHWGTKLSELCGCCTGHCLRAHTCASRIQGVLQLQVQRHCCYTLEASRILHTLHYAHLPAQQECSNAVGRGANVLRFRLGTYRSL